MRQPLMTPPMPAPSSPAPDSSVPGAPPPGPLAPGSPLPGALVDGAAVAASAAGRSCGSGRLAPDQLEDLAGMGYAAGNLGRDLGADLVRSTAWQQLRQSWERLPQDAHMADGGTYRQRRFSELWCDGTTGEVRLLPHRPFSQPRHINRLNGGVERHFAPFEPATLANPAFRRIVLGYVRSFDRIEGPGRWLAHCFQNRTLARPDSPGLPTPEGVHRDGMDYNAVVLIRRDGVVGGVSRVYDGPTRARLCATLLAEAGDHVVMDDRRLLHDATPVALAGAGRHEPGFRDALIISFTRIT